MLKDGTIMLEEKFENTYCDNEVLRRKISNTNPSITGLFPHEIAMLTIVRNLKIKTSGTDIIERLQIARLYEIGIQNDYNAFKSLENRGYIKKGDGYSALEVLKKNQLDKILRKNNIVPAYHKTENIQLVIDNLSAESVEKLYPEKLIYVLTEKANLELEFNPEVVMQPYRCWTVYDNDIDRKRKKYNESKSPIDFSFRNRANTLKKKLQPYPYSLEVFDNFIEEMWKYWKGYEEIFDYYEKVIDKLIEEEKQFVADDSIEDIFFKVPKEYNKRYYISTYLARNCNYVIEKEDCYELSIKPDDYYTMQMLIYLYKEEMAYKKEMDDVAYLKTYIMRRNKNDYMSSRVYNVLSEVMNGYGHPSGRSTYPGSILNKMYCKKYSEEFLLTEKNRIYRIIENEFPYIVRWSSEYKLFMFISNYVDVTIFQYRPQWLGAQSLDIYLDEYKVAVEYQGIQHYEETRFWGSYVENKKRDERKKELCKINGIKLLEWKYDVEINMLTVEKFLIDNNVPINRKKYSQIKQDYRCMIVRV